MQPMEARRSTLGAAVLDGMVYAVGGFDGSTGRLMTVMRLFFRQGIVLAVRFQWSYPIGVQIVLIAYLVMQLIYQDQALVPIAKHACRGVLFYVLGIFQ